MNDIAGFLGHNLHNYRKEGKKDKKVVRNEKDLQQDETEKYICLPVSSKDSEKELNNSKQSVDNENLKSEKVESAKQHTKIYGKRR